MKISNEVKELVLGIVFIWFAAYKFTDFDGFTFMFRIGLFSIGGIFIFHSIFKMYMDNTNL